MKRGGSVMMRMHKKRAGWSEIEEPVGLLGPASYAAFGPITVRVRWAPDAAVCCVGEVPPGAGRYMSGGHEAEGFVAGGFASSYNG